MVFVLALAAAFQASQPSAQHPPPPATAIIRGHVVAGDSGQPLRKAQVRLTKVQTAGGPMVSVYETRAATTDVDGQYEFKDLSPGQYSVFASKPAYVGLSWGQDRFEAPSTPVEVHAGERLDRVDFTLPRGGVVSGRIFDEFGEPLSGLEVGVMKTGIMNGKRQLTRTAGGSTNDLGEFRIFGIAPGQYYVQAIWRRYGPGDPASPDRTGYPVTFFPGTTVEAEAQRFTVAAGRTIGDLAMMMSPIKTARVEGGVVDADGRPLGNGYLEVLSTIAGNNFMSGTQIRPDGTFTFAGLAPGEYVFRTQSTASQKDIGMLKLTVAGEDVKDLRIVTAPRATIRGRIVIEPSVVPPSAALSLAAIPQEQMMPGGYEPVRVADDLTFELTANPGRNRIDMLNLPGGWRVRSVRVSSVDVIDDGIDVKPGENITGVDVELTKGITSVTGVVTNGRGERVKDYAVIVFPTDNKRWTPASRYMRTVRPDQDGRFKIAALPPADYHIVAIDEVDPNMSTTDPEFLERILPSVKALSLSDGEAKTVELKLVSVP